MRFKQRFTSLILCFAMALSLASGVIGTAFAAGGEFDFPSSDGTIPAKDTSGGDVQITKVFWDYDAASLTVHFDVNSLDSGSLWMSAVLVSPYDPTTPVLSNDFDFYDVGQGQQLVIDGLYDALGLFNKGTETRWEIRVNTDGSGTAWGNDFTRVFLTCGPDGWSKPGFDKPIGTDNSALPTGLGITVKADGVAEASGKIDSFAGPVTLEAAATGTGTLTYEWYKDGVKLTAGSGVSGVDAATLTVDSWAAAKNGQYTVKVTNTDGNKNPATAETSVTLSNNKVAQAALNAPTEGSKTYNSVTVVAANPVGGSASSQVQYAVFAATETDGTGTPVKGWQSELTFTDLAPDTTYRVFAKMAGNDDYLDVISANYLEVTTEKAPTDLTLNLTGEAKVGETLTAAPSKTVAGGTFTWFRADSAAGAGTKIDGQTGDTYTLTTEDHGKYIYAEYKDPNAANAAKSNVLGPVGNGVQTVTKALGYNNVNLTYGGQVPTMNQEPEFSQTGTISYAVVPAGVIEIDDQGNITKILKAGTAKITATNTVAKYDDVTSEVNVTVTAATPVLTVEPAANNGKPGDTVTFNVKVADAELLKLMKQDGVQIKAAAQGADNLTDGTPVVAESADGWTVTIKIKGNANTGISTVYKVHSTAVADKFKQSADQQTTVSVSAKENLTVTATPETQEHTYDGSAKEYNATVKAGTTTLTNGQYTVEYYKNGQKVTALTNVGEYHVVITPVGTFADGYNAVGDKNSSQYKLVIKKADQDPLSKPVVKGDPQPTGFEVETVTGGSSPSSIEYAVFPNGTNKAAVEAGTATPVAAWSTSTQFSGLTADTEYVVFARKLGGENHNDVYSESSDAIRTAKAPITGTLTITGTLKMGDTLTLTGIADDELTTGSIKWFRNDTASTTGGTEIVGETGKTYVLTADDHGKYIYAEFTHNNYAGTLTAQQVGPVVNATQTVTKELGYDNVTLVYGGALPTMNQKPEFSQTGTISYTVDPAGVIEIDGQGNITKILKAGTAKITATNTVAKYDNVTSEVDVTVTAATPVLTVEPTTNTSKPGDTVTFQVKVAGAAMLALMKTDGVALNVKAVGSDNIIDGDPAVTANADGWQISIKIKAGASVVSQKYNVVSSAVTDKFNQSAAAEMTITVSDKENLVVTPAETQKVTYDGAAKQYNATVKAGNAELTLANDYTVDYYQNGVLVGAPTEVGVYNVVFTPAGTYANGYNAVGDKANSQFKLEILQADQAALTKPAVKGAPEANAFEVDAVTGGSSDADIQYAVFPKGTDKTAVEAGTATPTVGWGTNTQFSGLTPDTEYVVFARKLGGKNYKAVYSESSDVIRTAKAGITGTLRITGTAKFGEKLSLAGVSDDVLNSAEIKWYRVDTASTTGGTEIGTGKEHTITAEDIGKYIYAELAHANYVGKLTAQQVGPVVKAEQSVTDSLRYPVLTVGNTNVAPALKPTFAPVGTVTYTSSKPDAVTVDPATGKILEVKQKADGVKIIATNVVNGYEDKSVEELLTINAIPAADVTLTASPLQEEKPGATIEFLVGCANGADLIAAGANLTVNVTDAQNILDGQPTIVWEAARNGWVVTVKLAAGATVNQTATLSFVTTEVAGLFNASNTVDVAIRVTDKEKPVVVVGGNVQTVTYNGQAQNYSVTSVTVKGSTLTENDPNGYVLKYYNEQGTEVANPVDAGTYNVVIQLSGNAAIGTTNAGSETGSQYQLVIEPAKLTLSNVTKTYDSTTAIGNAADNLAQIALNGYVNGEAGLMITGLAGTFGQSNAGSTTFNITNASLVSGGNAKAENYRIDTAVAANAEIKKAVPQITFDSAKLTAVVGSVSEVTASLTPAGTAADIAGIVIEYQVNGEWKTFQAANLAQINSATDIPVRAYIPNGTNNFEAISEANAVTGTLKIVGGGGWIPVRYYALSFETNGGSAIASREVRSGTTVKLTEVPTRDGYVFAGWYSDKELTQKVESIRVTKSTVVYAKWESSERNEQHNAYIKGSDLGTFNPDDAMTRAELAMIIYRLTGSVAVRGVSFKDTAEERWYTAAISSVVTNGYMVGYADGTFRPDAAVSGAEFTAAINKLTNTTVDLGVASAETLTRAQAVVAINKALGRTPDKNRIDAQGVNQFSDIAADFWAYYEIMEAATSHQSTVSGGGENLSETWTGIGAGN